MEEIESEKTYYAPVIFNHWEVIALTRLITNSPAERIASEHLRNAYDKIYNAAMKELNKMPDKETK